jgi:ZIP family zinc transporter
MDLWGLAPYALAPAVATLAGAVVAIVRPPGRRTRSQLQHFAAGLVFAAVAFELLPDVPAGPAAASVTGVALGIVSMLGLEWVTKQVSPRAEDSGGGDRTGLLALSAINYLIDGLVIGLGVSIGSSQGLLVGSALALDGAFMGIAVAVSLQADGLRRLLVVGLPFLVSLPVIVGTIAGALVLSGFGDWRTTAFLAFSAVALLYLVTEELLVEAHRSAQSPLGAALFYVGFLVVLLVDHFTLG